MHKTTSFISLFIHVRKDKDGNPLKNPDGTEQQFVSGVFTGDDGNPVSAFAFPGLKDAVKLVKDTAKDTGKPYTRTEVPVRIEYSGTDIADIRSIEAVPPDTETLGLVKAALA